MLWDTRLAVVWLVSVQGVSCATGEARAAELDGALDTAWQGWEILHARRRDDLDEGTCFGFVACKQHPP